MDGAERNDELSYDDGEVKIMTSSVVSALDDLPVLARLRFVKSLVCEHGGSDTSLPRNPVMVLSADVLSGIIDELERGPIGLRPVGAAPNPT
jgi:hypothetical protein